LTLLNDAVFFECAQSLGRRVMTEAPLDSTSSPVPQRIRHTFRLCLSREPDALEYERLGQLYQEFLSAARLNPAEAARLAGSQLPANSDASETAAWILLARTVMNLDEFVTRE
jgi:hypothetical protein